MGVEKEEYVKYIRKDFLECLKNKKVFSYHTYQNFMLVHMGDAWQPDNWSKMSTVADARMRDVYVLCNLAVLGFSIATAVMGAGVPAVLALVSAGVGMAWNYFDVAAGAIVAAEQAKHGEKVGALANVFAGVQLAAGTILFMLGPQVLHLVAGALAVAGVAASGFGFAVVMGISGLLEVREVMKGRARMDALESLLQDSELTLVVRCALKNYQNIERIAVAEHRQSAEIWGLCFLGMSGLAVVALVAFPTPIMVGAAVVSSCVAGYRWYRWYRTDRVHVKEILSDGLPLILIGSGISGKTTPKSSLKAHDCTASLPQKGTKRANKGR